MSKIAMKLYISFFFLSVLAFGQAIAVVQPGSAGSTVHVITIPISANPIVSGTTAVGLPNAGTNFSCTINSLKVIGNASGTIAVDIWKANAAIPSSGNKISGTAPATLSAAQINQAGSLAGWTTSVAVNDIFWASVSSADGVLTNVTIQIGCQ